MIKIMLFILLMITASATDVYLPWNNGSYFYADMERNYLGDHFVKVNIGSENKMMRLSLSA